ncbi:MAG: D-alanyl-D-alanine carboxypeptidase/D-alanyl-D-alanine-endopeptidase [Chitinispirillia bacterium]|nr:D-alanyl-D-alanine carboxypeptidase/D-alanyl-D-alanine-endopeptidase [Chitinispirillia bacterium]MCL2269255.1 D-alanyl-D-alanine carboxypeptidase/D-alanyl-D-alanine-endopeptidase [Chitinispirillia bacterium]
MVRGRKIINVTAVLLALCGIGFAQSLQAGIEALMKSRKYDTGGLGVVFRDLATDSVVVSVNADRPMNPASVQKLVTGAAAFEILGTGYVHTTRIFIDGALNVDSGIVNGNLYIRGAGEPGLNAEKMWLLVQHLRHRGIRRVTGDLIIDNFFFDDIGVGPGFSEEESRSYQALISALPASYSSVGVHHRPGSHPGAPVIVDMFPRIEGFKINNTATTVAGSKGKLDVTTQLSGGVTHINVRGTMGMDERPGYTYRRMWQTWDAFGGAFRGQCMEQGLRIDGNTVRRRVPDTLLTQGAFYAYGGEPLTEFIRHTFKWSSNFVAEMLFKTMGAVRHGEPGSWPKGANVVSDWWESRGLPGKPHIINGSGMGGERASRGQLDEGSGRVRYENLVSPMQMVGLLTYVHKQKRYFPDFLASLPSSGVDGTLHSRFRRSKLRGLVRAKTGTLNSVRVSTLAGYLMLDDKTYAFAIFCKNVGPNQFDNWIMQEQILEHVARVSGDSDWSDK